MKGRFWWTRDAWRYPAAGELKVLEERNASVTSPVSGIRWRTGASDAAGAACEMSGGI